MIQEELLKKLADIAHNKDAHEARNDYLLALRAVVELHKPKGTFADTYVDGEPNSPYCPECIDPDVYPCPTLQVIEKELG